MLQFVSQFLPIQDPSSHILIVFCGASPKLSLVHRISWVCRLLAAWTSSSIMMCVCVVKLLLFQLLIILHQWNLKEVLCTKFVMRVVYFVHNFNEVTIVYAYVVG